MKRVLMTVAIITGLMLGTAFPVFGLGETQVTLNCDDGTSMTTTVDPETLQSLVASVQAILDYPAGLTCTLLQSPVVSPVVSFGSVALAGRKPPFINGGGRFVHDCPSGGGNIYYTNFAVNAQTRNDGDVAGSFHMRVPDGQCVNGGSVRTRATCINVYVGSPGTYRGWLTSYVIDVDGPYFQVPYGVAETEYMRSGFQDSEPYGDAVNFMDANNSPDCATPDNTHYPVHSVVNGSITARPAG
jgi:hypothetical protein